MRETGGLLRRGLIDWRKEEPYEAYSPKLSTALKGGGETQSNNRMRGKKRGRNLPGNDKPMKGRQNDSGAHHVSNWPVEREKGK